MKTSINSRGLMHRVLCKLCVQLSEKFYAFSGPAFNYSITSMIMLALVDVIYRYAKEDEQETLRQIEQALVELNNHCREIYKLHHLQQQEEQQRQRQLSLSASIYQHDLPPELLWPTAVVVPDTIAISSTAADSSSQHGAVALSAFHAAFLFRPPPAVPTLAAPLAAAAAAVSAAAAASAVSVPSSTIATDLSIVSSRPRSRA